MNLRKKIKRNYYDYGLLTTCKKSFLSLFQNVFVNRCYRIYRINIEDFNYTSSINSDFTYKIIDLNDTDIISQIINLEEWLQDKLDHLLKTQSLCLVALDGENVAGFNIIEFGEVFIPLINLKRKLKHIEAWSCQITVNKDYRRKGLGTTLRHKIFEELRKKGIKRLYGGTLLSNTPNLKLSRKTGLKEIVDVRYTSFLNQKRWQYKRVRNETV